MWSYVLAAAGVPSLSYVGHSQGTTVLLAALSSQPELCGRLDRAVLLAPVAVAKHISSVPLLAMAALGTERVSSAVMWGGHRTRPCESPGVRQCRRVGVWVLGTGGGERGARVLGMQRHVPASKACRVWVRR